MNFDGVALVFWVGIVVIFFPCELHRSYCCGLFRHHRHSHLDPRGHTGHPVNPHRHHARRYHARHHRWHAKHGLHILGRNGRRSGSMRSFLLPVLVLLLQGTSRHVSEPGNVSGDI
jgi:hypothetical protein